MGYLHIPNLYKSQEILLFKECYALEKLHGSSAHISWKGKEVKFFSGGAKYKTFTDLFDILDLQTRFWKLGQDSVIVFGEAYGGKMQGMSKTYGKQLKFVVFDVKINDVWLSVPDAKNVSEKLGLEFVHYRKISTELDRLDAERNMLSMQAVRNGMGSGQIREGIVLHPLVELTKNNGDRVIAKYKGETFRETCTTRKVDPEKLKVLTEVKTIAEEWVTPQRLNHILDKLPQGINIEQTGQVIKDMVEDVIREAGEEIIDSKLARTAIGRQTAVLFRKHLESQLKSSIEN